MSDDSKGGQLEPTAEEAEGVLVPNWSHEDLRSVFHLFVGKPDSTEKIFQERVVVNRQKIIDLHEMLLEKLAVNHARDSLVASVDVTLEDSSTISFGGWSAFESHRWTKSEATEKVQLRWEFLIKIEGFRVPQRHALTVRLSSEPKPIEVMRAVFSRDPNQEPENIDLKLAPVICRVDFVNHVLSAELLHLVEEWVKGLEKPGVEYSWFSYVERKKEWIVRFIRYSATIISGAAAAVSVGFVLSHFLSFSENATNESIKIFFQWFLITAIVLYGVDKLSSFVANASNRALHFYGEYRMFELTNGDSNKATKVKARNRKRIRKFFVSGFISFLINLAAGFVLAWAS